MQLRSGAFCTCFPTFQIPLTLFKIVKSVLYASAAVYLSMYLSIAPDEIEWNR